MHGSDNDDDANRQTALLARDALLGLIDKSTERERTAPHTVPRARGSSRHVEVVDVAPLEPRRPRAAPEPTLSPLLVLGVVVLLITVFVAATQLR